MQDTTPMPGASDESAAAPAAPETPESLVGVPEVPIEEPVAPAEGSDETPGM